MTINLTTAADKIKEHELMFVKWAIESVKIIDTGSMSLAVIVDGEDRAVVLIDLDIVVFHEICGNLSVNRYQYLQFFQ